MEIGIDTKISAYCTAAQPIVTISAARIQTAISCRNKPQASPMASKRITAAATGTGAVPDGASADFGARSRRKGRLARKRAAARCWQTPVRSEQPAMTLGPQSSLDLGPRSAPRKQGTYRFCPQPRQVAGKTSRRYRAGTEQR